jgi:hypothetical protein
MKAVLCPYLHYPEDLSLSSCSFTFLIAPHFLF